MDDPSAPLLYLDQNYLSGMVKRKPAFTELEPVLREAVRRGAVAVVGTEVHDEESAPRPDLGLLALLDELSGGRRLPPGGPAEAARARRLLDVVARDFPERAGRASDRRDARALAIALPCCRWVTGDAFMLDVVRRTGLHLSFGVELFSGRRSGVLLLRDRLAGAPARAPGA